MLNSLAFVREKHLFHRNPSCWCVANHFQLLSFRTHLPELVDNKITKRNLTIDEVNALISELIDNSSISDEGRVLACGAVRDSAIKFQFRWKRCSSRTNSSERASLYSFGALSRYLAWCIIIFRQNDWSLTLLLTLFLERRVVLFTFCSE